MDYPEAAYNRDTDFIIDQLISEYDDTEMALPDIESEPHLLISKVRKHYMEYMIKLISINYETNQKLLNKNIYLPSAIWRCAKSMEMSAAHACMAVSLYRKNIVAEIKELKNDTKKGKLNRKLYGFLKTPPQNEKKTQTNIVKFQECNCKCTCGLRKKRRKVSLSPIRVSNEHPYPDVLSSTAMNGFNVLCKQLPTPEIVQGPQEPIDKIPPETVNSSLPKTNPNTSEAEDPDELMMQLEKLFQGDPNDDDIFEGTLCDGDYTAIEESIRKSQNIATGSPKALNTTQQPNMQDLVIENHTEQIKSLDERLVSLAGILEKSDAQILQPQPETKLAKKNSPSKWLCEEYFLKSRFFELLDQINDVNRKKLARIKEMLIDLFGPDSDDDGVVSPLEETAEFVISCKERIAPWVVKLLTPYYINGRIRGKALFKALAKHLIRLIYQCSRYPHEYEVNSFVADFLHNHKMIRCEADFKQFRIENI